MTTNTAKIAQLLRPGLKAVFGNYAQYPDQWTEIFKTYTSDRNYETEVEMKYLGAADIKPEGSALATDDMGSRVVSVYLHKTIGLKFTITQEAIEDNLYQKEFPQYAVSLKKSLAVTKNILGASVLNNAFNPAYATGDGQPACSASHPIDGGVYSNVLTSGVDPAVDFSEAGLEAALIAIQRFKMQSGILAQTMAQKLIIPVNLEFEATRLLNSAFRVGTANNHINAIYHNSSIPQGYRVNQFLTSPDAWFIITDADNGLKHYKRTPVKTATYEDFDTKSVMCSAVERYSFGISDCRGLFGSKGI